MDLVTLEKITCSDRAIISSDPLGLVLNGSVVINGGDYSNAPVLWEAVLPVDQSIEVNNVTIQVNSVQESKEVSVLNKQLNSDHRFIKYKSDLVEMALSEDGQFAILKRILEMVNKETPYVSKTTCPDPLNHKPFDIYLIQRFSDQERNDLVVEWGWNIETEKAKIKRIASVSHEFFFDEKDRFISAAKRIIPRPSVSKRNKTLPIIASICNLEHVLAKGFSIHGHTDLTYSDSGTKCFAQHTIKTYGEEFSIVWECRHIEGVNWECKVFGFSKSIEDEKNPEFIPFSEFNEIIFPEHIVYEFSEDAILKAIDENHSQSADLSLEDVISNVFDHGENRHKVAVSNDKFNLDKLTRNFRLNHTLSTEIEGYVRIYWDITCKEANGFESMPKAEFKVHSIRVSGIKYTYFHGTSEYDELISLIPNFDKILSDSKERCIEFLMNEHEPFYALYKNIKKPN